MLSGKNLGAFVATKKPRRGFLTVLTALPAKISREGRKSGIAEINSRFAVILLPAKILRLFERGSVFNNHKVLSGLAGKILRAFLKSVLIREISGLPFCIFRVPSCVLVATPFAAGKKKAALCQVQPFIIYSLLIFSSSARPETDPGPPPCWGFVAAGL